MNFSYISILYRLLAVLIVVFVFIPTAQLQAVLGGTCVQTSDCNGYSCNLGKDNPATPAFEGICTGPCVSDTECVAAAGALEWAGAKCTGFPAIVDNPTTPVNETKSAVNGVCLELPRSISRLADTAPATTGASLLTLVDTATNWVFAIFVILSIIFVLLAAFQFVTGGGDAKKIEEARQKLIWAAVGIIIALLAKGLVPVIRNIVGG